MPSLSAKEKHTAADWKALSVWMGLSLSLTGRRYIIQKTGEITAYRTKPADHVLPADVHFVL